MKLCLILQ